MRGDWLSSWSGLTSARSIGRDERNELSIGKRGRVGLVSRIIPYAWSSDVIETWRGLVVERAKRLIPAAGGSTTANLLYELCLKFTMAEIEFIGALTLYRDVKDAKVTAVQIVKTEKRSSNNLLFINALESSLCPSWCGIHAPPLGGSREGERMWVRSVGRPTNCSHSDGHCGVSH